MDVYSLYPRGATTDEIYAKAAELGLELCPAEVGPQLRLSYSGTEWMYIGMKQITGRVGYPSVFSLFEVVGSLKLLAYYAKPVVEWSSALQFVFRHRKSFLSRVLLEGAVFLFRIIQALLPATEHLADLIELLRHLGVMLIRDELRLPRDMHQILKSIEQKDAFSYPFCFLLTFGKISEI
jgi:hypothetical protein